VIRSNAVGGCESRRDESRDSRVDRDFQRFMVDFDQVSNNV
jgi:hypothetical protein